MRGLRKYRTCKGRQEEGRGGFEDLAHIDLKESGGKPNQGRAAALQRVERDEESVMRVGHLIGAEPSFVHRKFTFSFVVRLIL